MVFSSTTFLFVFLPIVFILYLLVRKELRNLTLFLVSLFFYFWGEQFLVLFLILSIIVNYFISFIIGKIQEKRSVEKPSVYEKLLVLLSVLFNLGMLGYFKYSNFFMENFGWVFKQRPDWVYVALPIGISFYTFQALSYVIDVYRGDVKVSRNIINFGCYLTFFPQLIAGPVVRYRDIAIELKNRSVSANDIVHGIERFVVGLGKKVLIANIVGRGADIIFSASPDALNPLIAWFGAICYMIQIFFDFSGYSDMAIGLGKIFGFHFLENFNYPYIARSIQDFWRRWHISLSTWFRDYLYIPLGGNRVGKFRIYLNQMVVFVLCGFWHGASWTFILWGVYHGIFLVVERLGLGKVLKKIPKPFAHIYTLFFVLIGWVLFRAEDLPSFFHYIQNMFGFGSHSVLKLRLFLDKDMMVAIVLGVLFSAPVFRHLAIYIKKKTHLPGYVILILKCVALILLLFVTILELSSNTFNPFLYYRF